MSDWKSVTKDNPCPICEHTDWCGWTASDRTGAKVVRCMRVDDMMVPGWRRIKTDYQGGTTYVDISGHQIVEIEKKPRPPAKPKPIPVQTPGVDLMDIHKRAVGMIWSEEYVNTAFEYVKSLGLSPGCIEQFAVGFTGKAYTVPMRDEMGNIIGIHLRYPEGKKLSVKGGHNGLFIPSIMLYAGQPIRPLTRELGEPLVLVEGWTDAAAILGEGFAVIGRPSNSGAVEMLTKIVRGHHVVILGDADGRYETSRRTGRAQWREPGTEGPKSLVRALVPLNKSVRLVTPGSFKDAREWIQSGAKREDILTLFRSAEKQRA